MFLRASLTLLAALCHLHFAAAAPALSASNNTSTFPGLITPPIPKCPSIPPAFLSLQSSTDLPNSLPASLTLPSTNSTPNNPSPPPPLSTSTPAPAPVPDYPAYHIDRSYPDESLVFGVSEPSWPTIPLSECIILAQMSYDYISKFEPAVLPTLVPEDGYGLATRGCNSLVVSPRKSGPEMETLTWDLAKQSVLGLLEWAKERQKGGGGGGGEGEGEVVTRAPVGLYIPSYRTEKYSCVGVLRWGVKHRGEVDVV